MKLHFSTEGATNSRYRKIKSVINALKLQVAEISHDSNSDLTAISVFNTLPLLETPQGTFFSSNTIIRYLASTAGNKLYGENLYQRALVDQWLDITTCDFESAVAAVAIARDGREVDAVKVLADVNKFLGFVEGQLSGKKFLVGDSATLADYSLAAGIAVVLASLGEEERKAYPHVTAWYLSIVETDAIIGGKQFPKESHKNLKAKKDKKEKKEEKKEDKKEEKKVEAKVEEKKVQTKVEEKKQVKDQNEVDLFGDDEESAAPVAPVKPKEIKPVKKKPAAKSIVVFDVKVYEEGYDLDALWKKIKAEVVLDGLVFNNEPKKIPVIGKIEKLQIGCVIEDDKVYTDDIFDKILSWEDDVQSVDIVSFQKL